MHFCLVEQSCTFVFVYTHRVINKLQPGSVSKINTGKMAFKLMENISNFLEAATRYGVAKTDLFQTVDLYEAENIPQVSLTLYIKVCIYLII